MSSARRDEMALLLLVIAVVAVVAMVVGLRIADASSPRGEVEIDEARGGREAAIAAVLAIAARPGWRVRLGEAALVLGAIALTLTVVVAAYRFTTYPLLWIAGWIVGVNLVVRVWVRLILRRNGRS